MDDHIRFAVDLRDRVALTDDDAIAGCLRRDDPAWLHLDSTHADTPAWIDAHMGYLDPAIRSALTQAATRPRAVRIDTGLLVNLRGLNPDPASDPEDMVSIRLWIDAARIVSLSGVAMPELEALAGEIASGTGPASAAELLTALLDRLIAPIEDQVTDHEVRTERLETEIIAAPNPTHGAEISDLRLELTELRRFTGPQRDAVRNILQTELPWIGKPERRVLGEELDRLTRTVEELDASREQLLTMRDEHTGAMNERLNRNLYVLSLISALFLPLGFLTGLMGINLAGLPGADWPPAFWVFCGLLAVVAIGVLAVLRWTRLL